MVFKIKNKKKVSSSSKLVKVGKIKLTREQKKRTFHLPVEQAVIVPSTSGVKEQRKISNKEMTGRVNNVRRFFEDKFKGTTSVKTVGTFKLESGKIIKEKGVKVTSFATKKDFNKNQRQIIEQVGKWGNSWKQESINYENEGDLFIIDPPKNSKSKPKVMKVSKP